MEQAVMKTLIALAASLSLNLTALAGLDWSARLAQVAPEGVVSITQLADPAELPAYAGISQPAARVAL
jgi:hypothetical protein